MRKGPNRRVLAHAVLKSQGTFESDKPAFVTLIRWGDGRVRFLVRENLEYVDKDVVKYGDGDELAILCTDQYSIYDEIDEYDEIDGCLVINHDEHYVVSDAHTSCKDRHSFLRNWFEGPDASRDTTYKAIFELLQLDSRHRQLVQENSGYSLLQMIDLGIVYVISHQRRGFYFPYL